jgi:hypothetical protein
METDYEALTNAVAEKVWETMNTAAGNLTVAPLEEQDDMVKFNLKSQVLPFVTVITPVVKGHVESELKKRIAAVIDEAYEQGHDPDFILTAVSHEISEDNE